MYPLALEMGWNFIYISKLLIKLNNLKPPKSTFVKIIVYMLCKVSYVIEGDSSSLYTIFILKFQHIDTENHFLVCGGLCISTSASAVKVKL